MVQETDAALNVLSRTVIYPHEAEALETVKGTISQLEAELAPNPNAPIVRSLYSQAALQLNPEDTQTLLLLLIQNSNVDTLTVAFDEYRNLNNSELNDTVEQVLQEDEVSHAE
jgi:hypothetical protein